MRLVVSVGAIVALLAVVVLDIRSLSDDSVSNQSSLAGAHPAGASFGELKRCRTITPEQLASDEACRRAWVDHRRRFFGLDHEAGKASTKDVPTPPSQLSETPPENTNPVNAGRPTLSPPQKD